MATAETENPPAEAPAPALPDYVLDADAVLKDANVKWRHGRAPDYSKTRKIWNESKPIQLSSEAQPKPPAHHTLCCSSQEMLPHRRLPARPGREAGQELGDRSQLQDGP